MRPVTSKMKAASRRNIAKAQISRIRRREPRQIGRRRTRATL